MRTQLQKPSIITKKELQTLLKQQGYYQGNIDGIIGPETNRAWDEAVYRQQMSKIEDRMRKAAKKSNWIDTGPLHNVHYLSC